MHPEPSLPNLLTAAPDLPSRARAIGKAVAYLIIAIVASLLVSAALNAATGQTLRGLMNSGPANGLLAHAGLFLALVVVPTALSLLIWRDPVTRSGWSSGDGTRLTALGLAIGAGLMTLIMAVLWAAGAWSGAIASVSVSHLVGIVFLSMLLWLVQAAHEEGLYRGYAFVQFSRALSFWPAALLLSLGFMWGHFGRECATPVSLAVAGLFALVFAYSLWRTGSL